MAKIIKKDTGSKSTEARGGSRLIKKPLGAATGGIIKAKPAPGSKVIKARSEEPPPQPEPPAPEDSPAPEAVAARDVSPAPPEPPDADAEENSHKDVKDPFEEPQLDSPREGSSLHKNPLIDRPEESKVHSLATRAKRSGPKASEVAAAIIRKAQADARALAEQVEQDIAASLKEARARGLREGHAQSGDLSQRVEHLAEGLLNEVESQAVETAITIARRLIAAELQAHPEAIVHVVRQALSSSRQQREVNIRVNPVHAQTLKDNKRELVDVLGRAKDVDVREDADLEPGGCMVETEIGTIDARLVTQFEALTRQLTGGH